MIKSDDLKPENSINFGYFDIFEQFLIYAQLIWAWK